eukprot:1717535-Amphidinium_carterae.1
MLEGARKLHASGQLLENKKGNDSEEDNSLMSQPLGMTASYRRNQPTSKSKRTCVIQQWTGLNHSLSLMLTMYSKSFP